jgi:hypothetical protein
MSRALKSCTPKVESPSFSIKSFESLPFSHESTTVLTANLSKVGFLKMPFWEEFKKIPQKYYFGYTKVCAMCKYLFYSPKKKRNNYMLNSPKYYCRKYLCFE